MIHSLFSWKNIVTFLAALMFSSNIFFFGPISIYQGNLVGFNLSLFNLLGYLLVPFVIVLIVLTLTGVFLSGVKHQRYLALITCLGLLFWLQGTFLIWNLGVLDGTSIDWTKSIWRGIVDGAIWIVLLAIAVIGYKHFYKISHYIVFLILLSQIVMVSILTFQNPEIWYRKAIPFSSAPPAEIFQFSRKQNVLHIVLDQFGSTLFENILKENKGYLEELDGFTFFKEVTSPTRVTFLSVPTFLSGQLYTNNMAVEDYYKKNYFNNNIHTKVSQHGYDLDVVNQPAFIEKRNIDTYYYNIQTPYNTITESRVCIHKAGFLVDLVLLRSVPFFLKKHIYNEQSWFISSMVLPGRVSQFDHYAANEFLDDFGAKASIKRDQPVYKYIHLMTPHPPLVTGSDHKFAGRVLPDTVPINFKYQAEYTLRTLMNFLASLKKLDIYNSTLIVIQSDHGSGIPFNLLYPEGDISSNIETFIPSDAFLPLLIIKPPNQKGRLKTSPVQGELRDLPATICALLGMENNFPGQSLFDMDTLVDRERKSYYSSVTNRNDAMVSGYFDDFQEFIITGSVFKVSSWKLGRVIQKSLKPYIWGSELQFFSSNTNSAYLEKGWGFPEEDHIWSNGKESSIRLPVAMPSTEMVELDCFVSPFLVPEKGLDTQRVTIRINNVKVGDFVLTSLEHRKLSVLFPKKIIAGSPEMLLSFSFPDATVGTTVGVQGEDRMLGLSIRTIVFKEHAD